MFLVVVASILMTSCTDLSEELEGEITHEIRDSSFIIVVDPIAGPYSYLRSGTASHGSIFTIQELTTDEMCITSKGGDWYNEGTLIELHQHTYTPRHPFLNNAWNHNYRGVHECNIRLKKPDSFNDNEIAQLQALRAFFYMRLLDLFGNVKIVTEEDEDPSQSTREEVFDFLENELLNALGISEVTENMDLSNSPLGEKQNAYQINTYGALGLLSKLYLNAEIYKGEPMYTKAAVAASYVIDSGRYSLCDEGCSVVNYGRRNGVATDPQFLEGYAAIFSPYNEGNPEHIFSINYDELRGFGMNFSQMNLHYSSQYTYNLEVQPWNGYATLEEFYNSYDDDDLRKKVNFLVGPQLDFGGNAILDYDFDDEDIQLNYSPEINEIGTNSLREAGARPAKFSYQQFGKSDMNNDFPLVRLGDLYLVRGEAKARNTGNWNEALDDVNTIRARAKINALTSLTAVEFLAERGREMFQESSRRTDLIRFGQYTSAWWEKEISPDHVQLFLYLRNRLMLQ